MRFLFLLVLGCEVAEVKEGDTGDGYWPEGDVEDGDGWTTSDGDCDDSDASVNPGAEEVCDGLDNNCDGNTDEDVTTTFFRDTDGDGFGDAAAPLEACEQPTGYVQNDTDCDDTLASVYPAAPENCDGLDNDCDGNIDEGVTTTFYADADGDGFGDPAVPTEACAAADMQVLDNTDCDDTVVNVNPGAAEVCDERDNDCDGEVDEGVTTTYFVDLDGDGYGADDAATDEACATPEGYADAVGDCDDADASFHPAADESDCTDPNDYNCDGSVAYANLDGDLYAACEECDDTDASVYPGAVELCNEVDDDCDGTVDEADAADASTWYLDVDADGYGTARFTTVACDQPADYVANDDDCDDAEYTVNPAATEVCNGVDDDCDGNTDDGSADPSTWYADADGDSYGDAATSTEACDQPVGYVSGSDDCDDADSAVNPAATEVCNGVDDDCDGYADDGSADPATWYADADGDSFGDAAVSTEACDQPADYVANDGDCDDGDDLVVTICPELGDGRDGSLVVSGSHDLSVDGSGGRAYPDGVAWAVSALGGTTLTVEDTGGLATGDLVLLIDLEGSGAGAWEVLEVDAVSGTTLTVTTAPSGSYPAGDNVFVQRIPQYEDLTVSGTLTTSGYDSTSSGPRATGIVAFKVHGTLSVTGRIEADELGYAGGCGDGPHGPEGETLLDGSDGSSGGWAWGGDGGGTTGGAAGSNSCGDSGGAAGSGGGGGAGKITHCAGGYPCQGGGGGGGGGAHAAVGNDSSVDLLTLLLGGGASAGAAGGYSGSSAAGGNGGDAVGSGCAGDGGGIVLVWARTASVSGDLSAAGGDATDGENGETTNSCGSDDGAGGGGAGGQGAAGGSILLACVECTLSADTLSGPGGSGGDGGRGGHGYPTTSGGGTGGSGASYGGVATSGSAGTYAGDGGAPGGGGAGGEAGEGGVIVVWATLVGGYDLGSSGADAALDAATGGELSGSDGFGP